MAVVGHRGRTKRIRRELPRGPRSAGANVAATDKRAPAAAVSGTSASVGLEPADADVEASAAGDAAQGPADDGVQPAGSSLIEVDSDVSPSAGVGAADSPAAPTAPHCAPQPAARLLGSFREAMFAFLKLG